MKIAVAFEKRDWGSGKPTWREVAPYYERHGPGVLGMSRNALRRLSNRKAKLRIFGTSEAAR